ncbi:hypothetical protein PBCVNEJV1_336R [Paramecium bursaria Chlorella virus NE-JV-1]|nr:hypothetical protein PBCVNEJV1_336R [Paramecium bursaria Chlorella virus NE-JV-1]
MSTKLPTSGSEELFTDYVFGSKNGKRSNNCYAFAIDWLENKNKKLQPGEISKTLRSTDDLTDSKTLKARVISDLATKKNGGYVSSPCVKCREGFYKIMAFVDPDNDYHFYRQMGDSIIDTDGKNVNTLARNMNVSKSQIDIPDESNKALVKNSGLWAHKRGLAELTVKDASGKFIYDPRKANRKYDTLDYSKYVTTFCVNSNFGKGGKFSCVK